MDMKISCSDDNYTVSFSPAALARTLAPDSLVSLTIHKSSGRLTVSVEKLPSPTLDPSPTEQSASTPSLGGCQDSVTAVVPPNAWQPPSLWDAFFGGKPRTFEPPGSPNPCPSDSQIN